jgi:prepilin-type N-terminal cleavage/methylation domain-containing protein
MKNQHGFTLIELVIIIVVLAIIAAVAIPRLGDVASTKAAATAEKIKSDIRYAQELAMTRNRSYRVYFNAAPAPGSGYAIVYDADGDGNWGEVGEFASDPSGKGDLSITLNSGDYAGVTASLSAGSYIAFNSLGRPTTGGGATITMSPGGYTIIISAETGAVN